MNITLVPIKEVIRINRSHDISLNIIVVTGRQGSYYVQLAPTILVSSYATTKNECHKAFIENLELFCSDLRQMTTQQRTAELQKMGFIKEKYHAKNFTKIEIDYQKALKEFDNGTTSAIMFQAIA